MKQIALSLVLIAASGAYVWEQAGKAPVDGMLSPALPADAGERGSASAVVPAAPALDSRVPEPDTPAPEIGQQNEQAQPRISGPPAVSKETSAAIAAPAPKPQPVARPAQVSLAPVVPPPPVTDISVTGAVPAPETPAFTITPAVYIPIPQPRPDYKETPARFIKVGMKPSVNLGPKPAGHGFADGTYTGPVTDAYYGLIQIQAVRRQNIRLSLRRSLAECRPHLGVDVMRRSCGAASADVGWFAV
ncbi:FMN-binding protein [Mesorhizobium sp. INR15]|nr:FMN-binding protein [Mesorhizobium sp. INR15]